MIKWIDYTEEMDKALMKYQHNNLLTIDEMMKKAKISQSGLYKFRHRNKISIASLKKIKKHLWIDLVQYSKKDDVEDVQPCEVKPTPSNDDAVEL